MTAPTTLDVLVTVGHQPWSRGAHNPRLGVSEYDFNRRLAPLIAGRLRARGVAAGVAEYAPGGGNVARWSGASALLVELHLNGSANAMRDGTCVLYGANRPDARPAAAALARHFHEALGLARELDPAGAYAVGPDRGKGYDRNGIGGGYLVRNTLQVSLVAEPFFISHDATLRRYRTAAGMRALAAIYADGIGAALAALRPGAFIASPATAAAAAAESATAPGELVPDGHRQTAEGNIVRADLGASREIADGKTTKWLGALAGVPAAVLGLAGTMFADALDFAGRLPPWLLSAALGLGAATGLAVWFMGRRQIAHRIAKHQAGIH